MKKQKHHIHWNRIISVFFIACAFCAFLMIAIWQFNSEQEIMTDTELSAKDITGNSSIKVDSPKINQVITSPVLVSGQAAVFEAQVNARIKDESGLILAETSFMTKEGQTMSPFSTKIKFKKPSHKKGTLEVYEISAKDGAEIHKISIPVIFEY